MMRWCLDCQTCKKAKCYQHGVCEPCNNKECHYEPFQNTIITQSIYANGEQIMRIAMWEENRLFDMMKANHEIYGREIKEINSASEAWAIQYFTDKLQYLLDYRAKCGSILFDVKGNGWSGIESIELNKDVKLTAKQCVDIGNFLGCGNVCLDIYSKSPKIDYYNSKKIINYLETGYSLDREYVFEPKYPNMTSQEIWSAKCKEANDKLQAFCDAVQSIKNKRYGDK